MKTEFHIHTDLMEHQQAGVDKMRKNKLKVFALFMDMGTGKTLTAIQIIHERRHKIDRVIYFCPVTLKETVRYEWLKHTSLTDDDLYLFDDKTRPDILPTDRNVYVIGIESMSASDRVIMTYSHLVTSKSFVIADESHYIKGHNSNRTLRITHMSKKSQYRMLLTGTPITQGIVDLYSQMYFLSPKILGYNSFYSFAANHLEYAQITLSNGRTLYTDQIIQSHNEAYIAAKIEPYIYQVKKDECLSLPDKLYTSRRCKMAGEQQWCYGQAKYEIMYEMERQREYDPILIFQLFGALQAISCGFWNRRDPRTGKIEHITFPCAKYDLLEDLLRYEIDDNEKVIIWCKYRHVIDRVTALLSKTYGAEQCVPYHGDIKRSKRKAQLARWRNDARFLIATQSTGGIGETYNETRYHIYFANTFKYSERHQSEDRSHRIGQTRRPLYIDLLDDSGIEEKLCDAMEIKADTKYEFEKQVRLCMKNNRRDQVIEMIKSL